jgi:hypothetical protein
MKKISIIITGLTLIFVIGLAIISFGSLPSIPLDLLVIEDEVLPSGWRKVNVFSQPQEKPFRPMRNLVIIWENSDISTNVGHGTFLEVFKYDSVISAKYAYGFFTSEKILPKEVYYSLQEFESIYADSTQSVCQHPNTGTKCRTSARYGQYIIIFQLDFGNQSRKELETDFQEIWTKIDTHIGITLKSYTN